MFAEFRQKILFLQRIAFLRLRTIADNRLAERARKHHRDPKPDHLLTGERGEDLAFFHLREQGYTVVARRWRSPRIKGDLDLVAWDGNILVIFEVKTRTARDFAAAETAVDPAKRRTLSRMALAYRGRLPEPWREFVPLRFDVLSVYHLPGSTEYEHLRNAFSLRPNRRSPR